MYSSQDRDSGVQLDGIIFSLLSKNENSLQKMKVGL
jgi:hypothetical protein